MSEKREHFSSRLGFILAAAGSAVGIGNLVGFPVSATKNGGGAFLLVYALFVIFICLLFYCFKPFMKLILILIKVKLDWS